MKTLYISDVDGTLTRGGQHLSPETLHLLKIVVKNEIPLVLATGRTIRGVFDIINLSGISYPSIVLNGSLVYDVLKNKAVLIDAIPPKVAKELCSIYEEHHLSFTASVFIESEQRCKNFSLDDIGPSTWGESAKNTENDLIHDERIVCDGSVLNYLEEGNSLYFGSKGTHSQISEVAKILQTFDGVKSFFHKSPYPDGSWFLDVVSKQSGKGTAAMFMKEQFQVDELVTFGDNFNDIPLLQAGNRSYAMFESPDEVKAEATGVLDADLNCVLRFILNEQGIAY